MQTRTRAHHVRRAGLLSGLALVALALGWRTAEQARAQLLPSGTLSACLAPLPGQPTATANRYLRIPLAPSGGAAAPCNPGEQPVAWSLRSSGEAGPAGPPGTTGPIGAAGPGGTGTTGPTGPSGPTGPVGGTGPVGSPGALGAAGAVGGTGNVGASGPTGAAGVAGLAGTTGATGATGAAGPTGAAGFPGPAGAPGVDLGQQVFAYTGTPQYYSVPAGVTHVRVQAWGAGGSGGVSPPNFGLNVAGSGGQQGSHIDAIVPVSAFPSPLTVIVGGTVPNGVFGVFGGGSEGVGDTGSGGGGSALLTCAAPYPNGCTILASAYGGVGGSGGAWPGLYLTGLGGDGFQVVHQGGSTLLTPALAITVVGESGQFGFGELGGTRGGGRSGEIGSGGPGSPAGQVTPTAGQDGLVIITPQTP